MKTQIFILIILVFSSCVFTKMSTNIQFSESIVELNNGEKIVGKVDFPLLEEDSKLKIKLKDKTQKINKNEISNLYFNYLGF